MKCPILLHAVVEQPGVYIMKDSHDEVLYIGKAKNLRVRLTTYFSRGGDDRAHIPFLLQQVAKVETIVVSSESEALLLEARLIQQWKPKYNILLKDDKSRVMIRMSQNHPFPRIELIRSRNAPFSKEVYGPFINSATALQLFDLIVRMYKLRQCTDEEFRRRVKPCLLYQLNRCSAPCVGILSEDAYHRSVLSAVRLLKGKGEEVLAQLQKEMKEASDRLDFEKAKALHDEQGAIRSALVQLETHAILSVHSADAIAFAQSGSHLCMGVMQYRNGTLVNSRVLHCEMPFEEDKPEYDQLILQYYRHLVDHEKIPNELLLSHELPSLAGLQAVLDQEFQSKIHLLFPQKGKKCQLVELAKANAEALLLQKVSTTAEVQGLLLDVQEELSLPVVPTRVDCFDVSHLAGKERVAACISFHNGKPYKRGYRTFQIKTVEHRDDCSMLGEAIYRRYRSLKEEEQFPDLLLIDGGKLQLKAAQEAFEKAGGASECVCALSKEEGRHDRGLTRERVWIASTSPPVLLDRASKVLHFLQRVRDEAHRFSLSYQKKRRGIAFLTSQLDEIPGIGPKKKQALLKAFSGIQGIKEASLEELCQKARLSKKIAEGLKRLI